MRNCRLLPCQQKIENKYKDGNIQRVQNKMNYHLFGKELFTHSVYHACLAWLFVIFG